MLQTATTDRAQNPASCFAQRPASCFAQRPASCFAQSNMQRPTVALELTDLT